MKKIFVILFGLIFVGIGAFMLIKGNNLAKRCTASTEGIVVEIISEESTDTENDGFKQYTYYPVIQYTVEGKTVSKKSSSGSNPSKYNVNDKVDILYDPNKVEDYIIEGDKDASFLGVIFVVAGIAVAIIGVIKHE